MEHHAIRVIEAGWHRAAKRQARTARTIDLGSAGSILQPQRAQRANAQRTATVRERPFATTTTVQRAQRATRSPPQHESRIPLSQTEPFLRAQTQKSRNTKLLTPAPTTTSTPTRTERTTFARAALTLYAMGRGPAFCQPHPTSPKNTSRKPHPRHHPPTPSPSSKPRPSSPPTTSPSAKKPTSA